MLNISCLRLGALFIAATVALSLVSPAAANPVSAVAAKKCRAGYIALTFDDGPSATMTPKLLKILLRKKVPATFFMVGERVASAPETAKLVSDSGFRIANHSYFHENMTEQSKAKIRETLSTTKSALRDAGVTQPIKLMRPPYGAMNKRAKRTILAEGYLPVLWNADSMDWSGGSSKRITKRVLKALSPSGSIVLQHDGITNSPNSIAAVPTIIKKARKRGYCFTGLNNKGKLIVPKAKISVRAAAGREGQEALVELMLSHPMPYDTSVYLKTHDDPRTTSAMGTQDYQPTQERVDFRAGETQQVLRIPVIPDEVDEATEVFELELSDPRGLTHEQGSVTVPIKDVRKPPAIAIDPAEVIEPERGKQLAQVRIRLGRASANEVTFTLRTKAGTAGVRDFTQLTKRVSIAAFKTSVIVEIPVRADRQRESVEAFTAAISGIENARVVRAQTTVTITQPTLRETVRQ